MFAVSSEPTGPAAAAELCLAGPMLAAVQNARRLDHLDRESLLFALRAVHVFSDPPGRGGAICPQNADRCRIPAVGLGMAFVLYPGLLV